MRYKYPEELHANEVAILPYYVANLNIEATYAAIAGQYDEFPNLCFVDTLDNIAGLRKHKGQQGDLFGALSEENVARIKRQNTHKISVIIGNPPYNANQLNENENNKNREYPEIDQRIKETYIAASTAQKTKLYDMYARFFRWASDRMEENGIIAFVTNRSFIDSRTFDGFRKIVADEFNDIAIVDLGGDVRADPRLSGTRNNVFGIQTGVAISFLVKRARMKGCRIRYSRRPQLETAEEKLTFLANTKFADVGFDEIRPDKAHNWINQANTDFDTLLPLISIQTKTAARKSDEKSVFKLYSNGVVTARDEWAYDFDSKTLKKKITYFADIFATERLRWLKSEQSKNKDNAVRAVALRDFVTRDIKWTEELEAYLDKGTIWSLNDGRIRQAPYRPFVHRYTFYARIFTHRLYRQDEIFPIDQDWDNLAIGFSGLASSKPFQTLAVDGLPSFDFLEKTQFLPRYRYIGAQRIDNITDWALKQFQERFKNDKKQKREINKDAIFHYVYGALHDPAYREKYALNLKREFPRIPFYSDFWRWAEWGEKLMALHIGYETVEPWSLNRINKPDVKSRKAGLAPKAMLKANKIAGTIQLDSETEITGVPPEAWTYKLGNRSALEWILDQYKEKKPKDPTIREKFNTYRFADHKEKVIDLLNRVARVSVETMAIVDAMRNFDR